MTSATPGVTDPDDGHVAELAALAAGRELLELRGAHSDAAELRRLGDQRAQQVLAGMLRELRPDDAVLSEEAADDPRRLTSRRVWIVDPLDGTREYGEPPRTDWAVHVALWEDGDLVAGAVVQPALGLTFSTRTPALLSRSTTQPRVAVSRTRPPEFIPGLVDHLGGTTVAMGSAGAKVMAILRDEVDVYVHAGGQYEWDSAAPVAVARAAGLHATRIDGSPLVYNRPDPLLPDLLVSRPEYAEPVLSWLNAR